MGILGNLSKAAKNRWYHASPDAFKSLDAEKLGTGEGGTDSMLGFHFSKKPSTAEGYLEDFPSINEDLFEQVHGMSISSAQAKANKLAEKYAKQNSMSVEDALDYKNPKSILGIRARAKDDTAKEFSEVNRLLNPYTYQDGYGGISSSKWLNKNRSGYIMSAELPDEKDMKIVDMGGDAYDEARHTLIGKQARDEGYKGVIFKNVVDDALSGSGKDDIALVFNPSDANIVDASSVGKASPVDFSNLKSIATGLTTIGLGSGALGMMSPEEQLFAAPAQREPEMRAIGGSDTEAQAATRNAAQTLGELLLSGDSPDITSTREAGETMMKIANNQPIGIMDALEVAGQVDPMQVPALIKALYNYSRQQ